MGSGKVGEYRAVAIDPDRPVIEAAAGNRRSSGISRQNGVDGSDRRRAAAIVSGRDNAFRRAGKLPDIREKGPGAADQRPEFCIFHGKEDRTSTRLNSRK